MVDVSADTSERFEDGYRREHYTLAVTLRAGLSTSPYANELA